MIKKKSKFFTIVFSILPGAGHMYMGLLKQGTSLMALFFGLMAFASWIQLSPLIFCIPIIWFYSFFDAVNKHSLDDVDFYNLEDKFMFSLDEFGDITQYFIGKNKIIIAGILIYLGISILWQNFLQLVSSLLPEFIYYFLHQLTYKGTQIIFAFIIIYIGLRLISGKKNELNYKEKKDINTYIEMGKKED